MTTYRGVSGVNREVKQQFRGVDGVSREIKEQYRSSGGINRKVFKKGIGGIDADTLAMYHFNNSLDDSSGHGLTLSSNTQQWVTGKFGKAWGMSSTSSVARAYITDTLTLAVGFGFDFWVQFLSLPDTSNWWFISHQLEGKNPWAYTHFGLGITYDGKLRLSDGTITPTLEKSTTVPMEDWHHIYVVHDTDGYWKVYLNGVLEIKISQGQFEHNLSPSDGFYIGRPPLTDHMGTGRFDEFRISRVVRWTENFIPPSEPYTT